MKLYRKIKFSYIYNPENIQLHYPNYPARKKFPDLHSHNLSSSLVSIVQKPTYDHLFRLHARMFRNITWSSSRSDFQFLWSCQVGGAGNPSVGFWRLTVVEELPSVYRTDARACTHTHIPTCMRQLLWDLIDELVITSSTRVAKRQRRN